MSYALILEIGSLGNRKYDIEDDALEIERFGISNDARGYVASVASYVT